MLCAWSCYVLSFSRIGIFFEKIIGGCLFFRLELFTDFFSLVKFICHHFLFSSISLHLFPAKVAVNDRLRYYISTLLTKIHPKSKISEFHSRFFLQTFYLALRSHQLTTNVNRILKSHDFDGDIVLFSLHIWQALSGATTLLPNLDKFFRKLISNSKPSLVNIYFALRISQF